MVAERKPAILLIDPRMAPMVTPLADEFTFIDSDEQIERDAEAVRGILFVGSHLVGRELMDRLPNLSLIVSPSAGIEGVDLAAARERGIIVTSGGTLHSRDVATYAVAMAFAARQRLMMADRQVRTGAWWKGLPADRRSMSVDRVGIVGMGPIGQAVAEGMAPLCREVGWYGPRPKDVPWTRHESVMALATWSDILILCARSDTSTAGLISAEVLEAIGPEGLFVNIARGFMVDEDALIAALKAGRLGRAALDVFVDEPTDPGRWEDVPNLLLSPHIAGITREAREAITDLIHFNLRTLVSGEQPRNIVTGR